MSLRTQVASGFAVVAFPVVIVALVAVGAIDRQGGSVDAVLQENDRTLEAAVSPPRPGTRIVVVWDGELVKERVSPSETAPGSDELTDREAALDKLSDQV